MTLGGVAILNGYSSDRDSGYGSEKGFGTSKENATRMSNFEREDLPRAASYTYLAKSNIGSSNIDSLKDHLNEEDLMDSDAAKSADSDQCDSSGRTSPENIAEMTLAHPSSPKQEDPGGFQISITRSHSGTGSRGTELRSPDHKDRKLPTVRRSSETGKKIRRRTWLVGSRSASPTKDGAEEKRIADSAPPSPTKNPKNSGPRERRMSLRRRDSSKSKEQEKQSDLEKTEGPDGGQRPSIKRKGTLSKAGRPLSLLLSGSSDKDESHPPPMPLLPKSFSTDRLPTLKTPSLGSERVPPLPRTLSSEKLLKTEFGRKKDELWSAFRHLDGEYQK